MALAVRALRSCNEWNIRTSIKTSCLSIFVFPVFFHEACNPPAWVEGGSFLLKYARDLAPSQHNIRFSYAAFTTSVVHLISPVHS
jgi:hypothetical protein